MAGPGPVGYIFHDASGKLIHPFKGSYDPTNGTNIVVYDAKNGPGRLQFRLLPQEGEYGYIEHISSGKIIAPEGGDIDPRNGTPLILQGDRIGRPCYFKFEQASKTIEHINGKIWHPRGGSTNPPDNTICVLHNDRHDGAKFYFGDRCGEPLNAIRKRR